MSTAYVTEHAQHLQALVLSLIHAKVRPFIENPPLTAPEQILVSLRPACQVWRVTWADRLDIEQRLRNDPDLWRMGYSHCGWRNIMVSLETCEKLVWPRARHPACIRWQVWHSGVLWALMQHGYYDPTTGHTPPAAQQLDAIERKLGMQQTFDECFPGLGGLKQYRIVTDEDGNKHAEPMDNTEEDDHDDDE
jgi:hypothetical protein